MKRAMEAVSDIASATKRLGLQTIASSAAALSSSLSALPAIELRIGLLPPLSKKSREAGESAAQATRRSHREQLLTRSQAGKPAVACVPHLVLPSESSEELYDVIQVLPLCTLRLSQFDITSASDGAALCQSATFSTQQPFDKFVATALPLNTPLRVKAQAAGFEERHRLFDGMTIEFTLTVSAIDEHAIAPAIAPAIAAGADVGGTVRRAHIEDASVRLTTNFSLLSSSFIPISARLGLSDAELKTTAKRLYPNEVWRGDAVIVFETSDTFEAAQLPAIDPSAVLDFHRHRVLAAGNEGHHNAPSEEQFSRDSVFPVFLSRCRRTHLSSFVLACAPSSHYSVAFEVTVQSSTDMQMRGFLLTQPSLRFELHNRACGEQSSIIRGRAKAAYTVTGSDVPVVCSADVRITALTGQQSLVATGDCLSVLRMADIFVAHSNGEASPPTHSSVTALPWTLDAVLASQLPWLMPSSPPDMPPEMSEEQRASFNKGWNQVSCDYHLEKHTISSVAYSNLTLAMQTSPSAPGLCVLLDIPSSRRKGTRFTTLKFRPCLQFHYRRPGYSGEADITTVAPMPLSQLLDFIGMPNSLVPEPLLVRVQFSEVIAMIVVDEVNGVAMCMVGTRGLWPLQAG